MGRSLVFTVVLVSLSLPAAHVSVAEELILLRDEPSAGQRLLVELREVGRVRLDVPFEEEDESGTALEDYPFLATATFFIESDQDREARRELLGHMAFTVDTDTRQWNELLEESRAVLANLGPEALDQPLGFGQPEALAPLSFGTLQDVVTPKRTVTCTREADSRPIVYFYLKEERTLPNGEKGSFTKMSSFPQGDEVDRLCAQMFEAASQTLPEVFRSGTRISSRRTLRVTLQSRGEVPKAATRRELLPRPDALEEHRHPDVAEGKGYKSMQSLPGGVGMKVRMALRDGSELYSSAGKAVLESSALDYPSLMLRWRVSHEEQRLGLMPGPAVASDETVVSVIYPLSTPLLLEEKSRIGFSPDESESLSFDADVNAMVERIGGILLRSDTVDSEALLDAHYWGCSALGREHFLIALCPEDASEAEYLVLPGGNRAPLIENDGFCREAFDRFQ